MLLTCQMLSLLGSQPFLIATLTPAVGPEEIPQACEGSTLCHEAELVVARQLVSRRLLGKAILRSSVTWSAAVVVDSPQ